MSIILAIAYINVDEPIPELGGADFAVLVLISASIKPGSIEFTFHVHDHQRLLAHIVISLCHFVLLINYNWNIKI